MEDRLEAGVWSEVTVKRYLETFVRESVKFNVCVYVYESKSFLLN